MKRFSLGLPGLKGKNSKTADTEVDNLKRIITEKTEFDVVETYKSIRTNIMFSIPKTDKGKIIAITSSAPGEGKTTTSINLAITFAQMGAKVILIDCDLRKARTHRYLQLERGEGVSNVLCGFITLDKVIRHDVRENMDVITAGEIPPNPAELLGTQGFSDMLDKLTEDYDYVFIDTPPVTVVTDAMIIAREISGVVVVVRQDVTTFDMLDETMESIKKANTKIIGVIMLGEDNKTKKYGYYRRGRYGHRYGYKYGYKYGYTYGYGDSAEEEESK